MHSSLPPLTPQVVTSPPTQSLFKLPRKSLIIRSADSGLSQADRILIFLISFHKNQGLFLKRFREICRGSRVGGGSFVGCPKN